MTPAAHPLASLIPAMTDDEYAALAADIRAHGLHEPIVLFEGLVLDGRHRQRACMQAGVEARYVEFAGPDPVAYVVGLNVARRHLTASQKAVVALRVEASYAGRARKRMAAGGRVSQDWETLAGPPVHASKEAAKAVGVSHGYVDEAKRIAAGAPDIDERNADLARQRVGPWLSIEPPAPTTASNPKEARHDR